MGAIIPFLRGAAFEPQDIEAMSMALDDVCKTLKLDSDAKAKEMLATRIIELKPGGQIADFAGTYEEYLKSQGLE